MYLAVLYLITMATPQNHSRDPEERSTVERLVKGIITRLKKTFRVRKPKENGW